MQRFYKALSLLILNTKMMIVRGLKTNIEERR